MKTPTGGSDDDTALTAIGDAKARLAWVLVLANAAVTRFEAQKTLDETAGQTSASEQAKAAAEQAQAIYNRAAALRDCIDSGLDAFNHYPDWVPILGLEYYENQLADEKTGALATYAQAEANHRTVAQALIANQNSRIAVAYGSAVGSQKTADCRQLATNLMARKQTVRAQIDFEHAAFRSLHLDLGEEVNKWKDKENKFKTQLSFRQVFEALSQFAFFPTPEHGAELTAGLLLKQASMVIGQGGSVAGGLGADQKDKWLVGELSVIADDVKELEERILEEADGTFGLEDLNGSMYLAQLRTLDELCKRYWESDQSEQVHKVRAKLKECLAALNRRNRTVLEYNSVHRAIQSVQAQADAAERLVRGLSGQNSPAPGLAASLAMMDMVVAEAKDECLRLLYEASRAYSFRTFDLDKSFHDLVGKRAATDFTAVAAKAVTQTLVVARRKNIDSQYPLLLRPNATGRDEFKRKGGVEYELKRDAFKDLFKTLESGSATIFLDPLKLSLSEGTTGSEAPFDGMREVRVRAVRCWLEGLTTAAGVHKILLTHQGDSHFLTGNALDPITVRVRHDAIPVEFIYRAGAGSPAIPPRSYSRVYDPEVAGLQDGVILNPLKTRVLVSPFATWHIQLPQVRHKIADASALESISFEFFVAYKDEPAMV